jgi:hypothetical protein
MAFLVIKKREETAGDLEPKSWGNSYLQDWYGLMPLKK